MKKIILLLPVLFFFSYTQAQFKPGDVGFKSSEFALYKKQHVKTAKITVTDPDGYSTPLQTNYYDMEGKLVKIIYDQDTTMQEEMVMPEMSDAYYYDQKGNVTGIVLSGYDIIDIQIGFEYNKGKLVNSRIAGAEAREYSYAYDASGNIIERIGKGAFFEVDDEGNPIDNIVMSEREKSTYTWDKKGNLVSEIFYMDGEFYYKIHYTYNDKGSVQQYAVYYNPENESVPSFEISLAYNSSGLPEKMVTIEEGFSLTNYFSYTYYED